MTVTTKDQFGNLIGTGGAAVTLTTTLGHWGTTGTATTTTATDNGNGTYSATLFSAQSGTATITGTVAATAIATPSVTVAAIATVLDHFDVTLANGSAFPASIQAGVATAVRIRALDASGNVVASYSNQTTLSATNTTLVGGGPTIIAAVAGVINTSVAFGQLSDGAIATLNAQGNGQVTAKTGSSSKFAVVAGPAALMTTTPGDSVLRYGLDQTPDGFPTVYVTDAGGNITGHTQTVSFTVNGPCTLNGSVAKTAQFQSDVEGAIVFNSSMITIPTGGADFPFSCQLVGTAVGFTAPPIQLALIVQQSGSTTFMEHTNQAWETVDNWTNLLPSSNTAFIAAAQPHPNAVVAALGSNPTIGSIDVEDGATLNLSGHTLSVFQNIDSRASGTIFGGTINVPLGANGGYLRGQNLPTVNCQSGTHTMIGQTQIFGSLTLNNCTFDVTNNLLTQSQGTFATAGAGGLIMNSTEWHRRD